MHTSKRFQKKKKIWSIILLGLVVLGIVGGVLIRFIFFQNDSMTMKNAEAIRLIRYLGVSDYEYPDRLGSSFTVREAKKLCSAAGVSFQEIGSGEKYMPGFMPLTREQFENLYSKLVDSLELDRLFCTHLYIYGMDSSLDKEIDGTVYEIISTNMGDFYMEKDYGISPEYIGKVVKLYISNNEIILCLGESKEEVIIKNVYVSNVCETDGEKQLLCYMNGMMQKMNLDKGFRAADEKNYLADVMITNKGITQIIDHTADFIDSKVNTYQDGMITIEGKEEPLMLSEEFQVYKTHGTFKTMKSAGMLIGYESVSLYIKDNVVEAACITEDIYEKNIRVLINNTEYTSLYHNVVNITADTAFTVSYGDTVEEYAAGDKLEYRNGSKEFAGGNIRIKSKEEDGKIRIYSISRQCGSPEYRGTIELTKDDKGVLVVNELAVEQYLYGVVPSEMPVSYEVEALKAQAICARAYAYRQMESETYAQYGAHLEDSISSQVYNNVEEDERTTYAVDDTYGVVPCYNGEVVEAFFFSTSCGTTTNNSSVWGGNPEPYLLDTMETELNDIANLSEEDSFRKFMDGNLGGNFIEEEEPFFRWNVIYSKDEITQAINAHLYERIQLMPEFVLAKNAKGAFEKKAINSIGEFVQLEVTKRANSGLIEEMIITGTEETVLVKGQSNARALISPENVKLRKQDGSIITGWKSLPSAYFYVEQGENINVHGGGFGHGVGMSQNGANDMAKLGYTASSIISHYYTAVELKDMYQLMGR